MAVSKWPTWPNPRQSISASVDESEWNADAAAAAVPPVVVAYLVGEALALFEVARAETLALASLAFVDSLAFVESLALVVAVQAAAGVVVLVAAVVVGAALPVVAAVMG